MIVVKKGNNSEISNVIATNFNSLKNIIPDLDSNQLIHELSKKENFIILPQKISKTLFPQNGDKTGSRDNSSTVTIHNINQQNIILPPIKTIDDDEDSFNVIATVNSTGNPIIDNSVFIETKMVRKSLINLMTMT